MKKIFAILLSFQFILAPVALADQAATGKDNYVETGYASQEGGKQYLNSMLMTGSGAFGSLFINCQAGTGNDSTGIPTPNTIPTFSHYIFMAGAIVLLLGEIIAATKQQKELKKSQEQVDRMTKISSPAEGATKDEKDLQLKLLNQAVVQEMNNRDALKQRQDWMTAAEVVYWLAVAGATTETILYAVTKALMATSTALKVPPVAVGYPAAYAAEKAIGYYSWRLGNCVGEQNKMTVLAIGAAYGVVGGLTKGAQGALMGGLSTAMFMAMMYKLLSTSAPGINSAMATAPGRIVIFGVFAALASIVKSGYKKRVTQANKNIDIINKQIAEWEGASTETNSIALGANIPGTDESGGPGATKKKTNLKALIVLNKTGKCLGAAPGGVEHSSKSCAKPIKFNRSAINFKSNFLKGIANKAFDMSEAMANDDADGASMHAADLGNNAARVKAEAMDLIKAANAQSKKNGEKELDFDKEVKAQLATFSNLASQAAASSGMPGIASGGSAATLDADVATEEKPAEVVAVAAPAAVEAPAAPDLTIGSEDLAGTEETAAVAAGKSEQSLDDFESSEQDVSKKSDVSIFKQLSNRYILNYTKMFERKKEPEVVVEEAKSN